MMLQKGMLDALACCTDGKKDFCENHSTITLMTSDLTSDTWQTFETLRLLRFWCTLDICHESMLDMLEVCFFKYFY